jgi:iron(III) transport system ATP-binding protein
MSVIVKVRGLHKSFWTRDGIAKAVKGVDFDVQEGEFFTLLGPSGCGKTTIMRCIAGLEVPDGGELELDGEVVFSKQSTRNVPANKRHLAMVFQSYAIWPHMNTYDNIAFPLRMKHMAKREIHERVMRILETLNLQGLEKKPATALSGGQQQRVAIGRALIRNSPILLLDEPLSNLDAKLRVGMRVELRELQQKFSVTTIYVTHDQEEAVTMSDQVAVMNDGLIIDKGPPLDIYLRPNNFFTANFLGAANFLQGIVIYRQGERTILDTSLGKLEVLAEDVALGNKLSIFIRPEHIEISKGKNGEDANPNIFSGIILSVGFGGKLLDCLVKVREQVLKVQTLSCEHFEKGESILVHLRREQCVILRG